jgi:hypothetical protein
MRLEYELPDGAIGAASSLSDSTADEPLTLSSLNAVRGLAPRLLVVARRAEAPRASVSGRPFGRRPHALPSIRRRSPAVVLVDSLKGR